MGIVIPLVMIFFCCLFIWRACDGFEVASEYLGRNLTEGVRGGTINAISSSIPELFTTAFALLVLSDTDGFSVGLGTTAGSALFNGMIIPAVCILVVVGAVVQGIHVDSIKVSRKVLRRDGLSLIFCEAALIFMINGNVLTWQQGLLLMCLYFAYFGYMLISMKAKEDDAAEEDEDEDDDEEVEAGVWGRFFYIISLGPLLDLERWIVREHHRKQMEGKEESWSVFLCMSTLLLMATAVIGLACWLLVTACEWLGSGPGNASHASYHLPIINREFVGIGMPTMFVAVIFASMATSVPDTVISIRDAKKGDYDDAVANALGSNIFDICFALGFPLFVYTFFNGPISLTPEIAQQSGELRLLLLVLTIVGFCIYYFGKQVEVDGVVCVPMRRGKAIGLLVLYLCFVCYVLGRSWDWSVAQVISDFLSMVLQRIPTLS